MNSLHCESITGETLRGMLDKKGDGWNEQGWRPPRPRGRDHVAPLETSTGETVDLSPSSPNLDEDSCVHGDSAVAAWRPTARVGDCRVWKSNRTAMLRQTDWSCSGQAGARMSEARGEARRGPEVKVRLRAQGEGSMRRGAGRQTPGVGPGLRPDPEVST